MTGQVAGAASAVFLLNGWVNYSLLQPVQGLPEPFHYIRYRLDEAAFVLLFLFLALLFGAMFAVLPKERGYLYLAVFALLAALQLFSEWDEKRWFFGDLPVLPYSSLALKCMGAFLAFSFAGYLFGVGNRRINRLLLALSGALTAAVWVSGLWGETAGVLGALNLVFLLLVLVKLAVSAVQFASRLHSAADREELRWSLLAFLSFMVIVLPDVGKDLLESLTDRQWGYLNVFWEQCLEDTFAWALLVLMGIFGVLFFRRFTETLKENRRTAEALRERNAILSREVEIREQMDRLLGAIGRSRRGEELEAVLLREGRELFRPFGFHLIRMVEGRDEWTSVGGGETLPAAAEAACRELALEGRLGRDPQDGLRVRPELVLCTAGSSGGELLLLVLEDAEGSRKPEERERFMLQLMAKYAAVFRENFRLIDSRLQEMLEQRKQEQPWVSKLFMQLAERERKRLASDLHDEVLQEIMHLRRLLDPAREARADGAADRTAAAGSGTGKPGGLEQILLGLDNAEFMIRETCQELLPSFLHERGLLHAVSRLAEKTRLRADFELELTLLPPEGPMGNEETLALYRIVQELVNNAVKHSEARHVRLTLGQDRSEWLVLYEDDGVGMAPGPSVSGPGGASSPELGREPLSTAMDHGVGGLGLLGMAERVRLLNGRLQLDSAPGRGLRVRCTIPVRQTFSDGGKLAIPTHPA
ncbi:ATP-binding protein [Gorillibacterium sp. sgz5001074]|uniref:sensor histidine kinase n=1 Tax=Gorillibacterium sp. sgz5001074 TaxID=3446695 RepID=UPI003F680FF0